MKLKDNASANNETREGKLHRCVFLFGKYQEITGKVIYAMQKGNTKKCCYVLVISKDMGDKLKAESNKPPNAFLCCQVD